MQNDKHSEKDRLSPPRQQPTERQKDEGFDERKADQHHVPGAEGPLGAEAEEDNNP